jgi:lipoprotein-anchoring transpeptidase ErfK/SrfK
MVLVAGAVAFALTRGGASNVEAAAAVQDSGPAQVYAYPPDGSTGVALDSPVSLVSPNGRLLSVTVSGGQVSGRMDPNGHGWTAEHTSLAPNTTYTVTALTVGANGVKGHFQASFTTVAPRAVLSAKITPSSETVGVGEPVIVKFSAPVLNKADVAGRMSVTGSKPFVGGWHWFSDTEAHFRPSVYWPANAQFTVTANLAGVDAGNGVWGESSFTATFQTGDSHVSVADLQSHQMQVYDNGQLVRTIPISGGRPQYPTMNGVHIVLDKEPSVIMDSATVGIPRDSPDGYYETVYDDVHISDTGEYVHAAPWSVGAQGSTNVSHGCINISPSEAQWFYGFSQVGDIVAVQGSPRPPDPRDPSTMDWNVPWPQWDNSTT